MSSTDSNNRLHTTALSGQTLCVTGVLLPGNEQPQDITIVDGAISSIDASGTRTADNIETIDAHGCHAYPGLIDLYSRCREPGLTRKGNIATESIAALSAGFTTVLCSPDTLPAVDSVATVELINHRSMNVRGGARIIPMAALTIGLDGEQLSELATLKAAGCPVASQADRPIENTTVLYSAMEYASSFDMPLLLCARDAQLGVDGCAHTGAVATQLGLPTIPVAAETVALTRLVELCSETQVRLHISRVSSARALRIIKDAKAAGLPITCDVGIHHLFFIDEYLAGYDASFHSAVPFRSADDRQALRDGLSSGVIDAVCSDHAPHDVDAGLAPFPVTEPGLAAYDWFMPLLLQLPQITGLDLDALMKKLHDVPADILGQQSGSGISVGGAANFFVLDKHVTCNVQPSITLSAGSNNPLALHDAKALSLSPLKGAVTLSFCDGWATRFNVNS